jgi:4a-hydroxytetrahydrobiopterin dehydratase
MRRRLSDDEVVRELAGLPNWTREGDAIVRSYRFARFADGIAFVQRVARVADERDHHPDIDIRYTTVRLSLSTHDAGGITAADVRLAKEIAILET